MKKRTQNGKTYYIYTEKEHQENQKNKRFAEYVHKKLQQVERES